MCQCHDPIVFGHRCKNEPTGGIWTREASQATEQVVDMLDVIRAVLVQAGVR